MTLAVWLLVMAGWQLIGPETGEDIGAGRPAHPLEIVRQRMKVAASDLSAGAVQASTLHAQSDALRELKRLLDQARAGEADSSSSPRSTSAQDTKESSPQSPAEHKPGDAPGEIGNASVRQDQPGQAATGGGSTPFDADAAANDRDAVFGSLPDRVRERLRGLVPDSYLPGYERLIADYYDRLRAHPRATRSANPPPREAAP